MVGLQFLRDFKVALNSRYRQFRLICDKLEPFGFITGTLKWRRLLPTREMVGADTDQLVPAIVFGRDQELQARPKNRSRVLTKLLDLF